jgi:hypothetical protein
MIPSRNAEKRRSIEEPVRKNGDINRNARACKYRIPPGVDAHTEKNARDAKNTTTVITLLRPARMLQSLVQFK